MTDSTLSNVTADQTKIETEILHASGDPPSEQKAQMPKSWIPFSDCAIAFAIDTSGSTLGHVLTIEQQAVRQIWALLTSAAKMQCRILPWNSTADPVIDIAGLHTLRSYGGTQPGALVENTASRHAIRNSTLWVLLTDGQIAQEEIEYFANDLAANNLHGIACIVIVCAGTSDLPYDCDISVGVAAFAATSDCLFLYVDIGSNATYLLQCSGRFSQILEMKGKKQPVLDPITRWKDLPQISLQDLACVSIPAPKNLAAHEIALQGDLVINVEELWSGRITDDKTIDQIFRNSDNLKAIMLTAQTRGRVEAFQDWLKPFMDPGHPVMSARVDEDGKAMKAIKAMLEEMQSGVSEQRKQELQRELSLAHAQNQAALEVQYRHSAEAPTHRRVSSVTAYERSEQPVTRGGSLSTLRPVSPSYSDLNSESDDYDRYLRQMEVTPSSTTATQTPVSGLTRPLLTINFLKSSDTDSSFDGFCQLCGSQDVTLSLLFRKPPSQIQTPGFPAPNSNSKLAFPLAMGNFPETDVLSSYICCDSCSFYLAQAEQTPLGEDLVCVLPIVSYSINQPAYEKQLKLAFDERFDGSDSVLVLVAVLVTTADRLPKSSETDLWRQAVTWLCRTLIHEVQCPATLSPKFSTSSLDAYPKSLERAIADGVESVYHGIDWENFFRYPLEGFVIIMLALEYLKAPPNMRYGTKNIIWHRFLYYLTEQYHQYQEVNGSVLTHLAMTKLVLEVNPRDVKRPTNKRTSMRTFRDLARNMLGDRRPEVRLLLNLDLVLTSPLLKASDMGVWKRLKSGFDWIDTTAGYALGAFIHHLARVNTTEKLPQAHFSELKKNKALRHVFLEPSKLDVGTAEALVDDLPPMLETESLQE